MQQFPNFRQPALGIQDAVMLPAQSGGLTQRQTAYVPATTQNFDSTTSSTQLNSTLSGSGGGSLRSLMLPMNTDHFVPITASQPQVFYRGPMYSQFGNQELINVVMGSCAGRAVLNACGIDWSEECGCQCNRELSDPVEIDEENTNGIIDPVPPRPVPPVYTPPRSTTVLRIEPTSCMQYLMCNG